MAMFQYAVDLTLVVTIDFKGLPTESLKLSCKIANLECAVRGMVVIHDAT